MLCWDLSSGSIGYHPWEDLRIQISQNRPRPTNRNRRADSAIEKVSSSRNGLGVRFSNYFSKFWLQRFPAVWQNYRCSYLLWYDTNKRYGTGTRLHTDSLVDPSSTAIPFATNAQAVTGDTGIDSKKRLQEGITDRQTDKWHKWNEWMM